MWTTENISTYLSLVKLITWFLDICRSVNKQKKKNKVWSFFFITLFDIFIVTMYHMISKSLQLLFDFTLFSFTGCFHALQAAIFNQKAIHSCPVSRIWICCPCQPVTRLKSSALLTVPTSTYRLKEIEHLLPGLFLKYYTQQCRPLPLGCSCVLSAGGSVKNLRNN